MTSPSPEPSITNEDDLRATAIKRIKRKREFIGHVIFYLIVNAALWIGWAFTGADTDSLWPLWFTGIWGVLVVIDAFRVYGERPISDQQISKEMRRLQGG
jgi:hypothetical protein